MVGGGGHAFSESPSNGHWQENRGRLKGVVGTGEGGERANVCPLQRRDSESLEGISLSGETIHESALVLLNPEIKQMPEGERGVSRREALAPDWTIFPQAELTFTQESSLIQYVPRSYS